MLHHVEFNVSDLERSIAFWGWLLKELGYEEFQRWPEGISWKQGETYLVFVQTEARFLDLPYHRKRAGLNHIAFHAESKTRVDELRIKLEERDIPMLYTDRYPYAGGSGHYAVFFEDPDRMKVEIVARR
ncbi:VOC family protein [Paenibacillus thiaminolyticus]|uniref:VOC family protein n=1 Tax=Paenibacillus thiaminolyticus TaxID=49283 RepID=UPI00232D2EC5|nr:VOC family protein [Paenibacillus thiaminolyticus]WCF08648.1 VOC family protein [Paenibacillus thiaminolyticus]